MVDHVVGAVDRRRVRSRNVAALVVRSAAAAAMVAAINPVAVRAANFAAFPNSSVRIDAAILAAAADVPVGAGLVYDASGNSGDIQVVNFGTVIYTGTINVATTIARVAANQSVYLNESDDGGFFNFNPGELPNIPRMGMNYYMEFMVWPLMNLSANTYDTTDTPYNSPSGVSSGDTFPGPERILIGSSGEVYYTGNHYSTNDYVSPSSPLQAITVNLWNKSSGSWSTAANWAGGHVPVTGEAAYLSVADESTRTVTYDFTGSSVTLGDFLVNADGTLTSHGSMTLQQSQGNLTTAKEEVWARYATADVFQSGGTDTVNGTLQIGALVASTGLYNLSDGTLSTANEYIGSTNQVASAGTGIFNQTGGTHSISGTLNLGFSAGGTGTYLLQAGNFSATAVNVNTGGTFNVTGGNFSAAVLNVTGGVVNFNTSQHVTSLNISSGTVQLNKTGSTRTVLFASAISSTGTLDLTGNDLDISGSGSTSLAAITALVNQGYSNGSWTGTGITSSLAAGNSSRLTAVGVIQNNQSGSAIYTSTHQLDGFTPTAANDVLVKYTYYGDANLDGKVDGSDYSLIDSGYLNHLTGWFNGDFNYDGGVDGSDYTLIDNAFNIQGAVLTASLADPTAALAATSTSASVPEPASLGALSIIGSALLGRRRRRLH